jgi:hypothetical protein
MPDWIQKYWVEVIFGGIVALLTALYKKLSSKVHKQLCDSKSVKDGTQALLRNEIIKEYDKYIERGYIPIYAKENVTSMYEAYHALGGNGTITKLMDELKELPTKKK